MEECVGGRNEEVEASGSGSGHGRVGRLGRSGGRRGIGIDRHVDEEVASGCDSCCGWESDHDVLGRASLSESASRIAREEEATRACGPDRYPGSPGRYDDP